MSFRKFLEPRPIAPIDDWALLLLRVVCGCAFLIHGWGKIQHPMGWMGPSSSVPPLFQLLAAISEFGGGIAWILGLGTRLASLGIGATMAVAVTFHVAVFRDPFVNPRGSGSYELALLYLLVAILFFAHGPGRASLDRRLLG